MNRSGILAIIALLIGSIGPEAGAQIEPAGPVPTPPIPAEPAKNPIEATVFPPSGSPFADPSMYLDLPNQANEDTRDLNIQPEFIDAPKRTMLTPITENLDKIGTLSGTGAEFQVPLGQGRILTLKDELTAGDDEALIAIGNPGIIDATVISTKQLRVTGLRVGVTDLSITNAKGETIHYEVHVMADLTILQKKIRTTFPDASVHLSQVQNHVIVEGQARSQLQVSQIITLVSSYLDTLTAMQGMSSSRSGGSSAQLPGLGSLNAASVNEPSAAPSPTGTNQPPQGETAAGTVQGAVPASGADAFLSMGGGGSSGGALPNSAIVNLLKVPTSQQVLLKVRVAELNRTGLRNIGANFLGVEESTGAIIGTKIAGPVSATGTATRNLVGTAISGATPIGNRGGTTVFGIFQNANFEVPLNALRRNGLLKILAEPNLVALSGQTSNFLVGGEFPVPVPQVGASGIAPTITVRFKEFGVRLGFIPYVLDDETLRLTVAPEVSEIDFAIGVTLVEGGSLVPGLNVRRSMTTVEMKHGQTLAIAGLLYLKMDGTSDRIPGLGDLPVLGPFFSNTSAERIEKELVILITPYIVEPMEADQVTAVPGSEVGEPTDWEFYFLNRIESRKGVDFRSTTAWDNAQESLYLMKMRQKTLKGEVGYSD